MKKIIFFTWVVLCMIQSPGTLIADDEDAGKIVENVEKNLEKLKTVACSFEQIYYRKVDDRTIRRTGTLWLKKPYLLRFEDPNNTVVIDGTSVWMYVPRNNQVQLSTFIEDDVSFPTPESLFRRYSKTREAEFAGSEEFNGSMCDVLLLNSTNPEEPIIHVWIDRDLDFPVKTLEDYTSGDTVEYQLHEIWINGDIDESLFTFTPPEGVEIIDMRE